MNSRKIILLFLLILAVSPPAMDFLRTPDSRFVALSGYDFPPNYVFVDDYEGDSLRMHYIVAGPDDSPAVLMIHGNPTWCYQFREVIPHIVDAGYRAIAIDLIGMGRSDKPADFDDYTYDRHAGWVSQIFAHLDSSLDLDRVTIFGHDYGTPFGIRLMAEHYPLRFDAFIDANASLPDGDFISPVHLNWREFVRDNPDVPVGHVISNNVNPPLTPEEIYAYYAPFPDSTYKMAVRSFPEMVPDSSSDTEAVVNIAAWEFMETFERPFMTIFSDYDPSAFPSGRIEFIDRVPGAFGEPHPQLDVAHYAPEDRPEEVAEEVIRFLDDVYHPEPFIRLHYSRFDSGFAGFESGGADCTYDTARHAVRIQSGSGTASSVLQSDSMDLSSYGTLKVAFRYIPEGMDSAENFVVELWNGAAWIEILNLVAQVDFSDDANDYGFVRINCDSVIFASDARIRIRCDATDDSDAIYLFNLGIYARIDTMAAAVSANEMPPSPDKIEVSAHPNPFNSAVSITAPAGAEIEVFDVNGRIVATPSFVLPLNKGEMSEGQRGFIWRPDASLGSGVYLVRATVGEETVSKRVVYLK